MSKIFNRELAMNIKGNKCLNDLINRVHSEMVKVVTEEKAVNQYIKGNLDHKTRNYFMDCKRMR